jgi:hypothetical protein
LRLRSKQKLVLTPQVVAYETKQGLSSTDSEVENLPGEFLSAASGSAKTPTSTFTQGNQFAVGES